MVSLEGVAELGALNPLAGEQASQERKPTPLGITRLVGRLTFVLLAYPGDDAVIAEREGPQDALELGGADPDCGRLLEQAIGEQTVTGRVATEDCLESNAIAGGEARLRQQLDRERDGSRSGAAIAAKP